MDKNYSEDQKATAFADIDGMSPDTFSQVELTEPQAELRPRNDGRVRSCLRKIEPAAPARLGDNVTAAGAARKMAVAATIPSEPAPSECELRAQRIREQIGPEAAQRLSRLPEGIGILQGKSSDVSEEETIEAIRGILDGQDETGGDMPFAPLHPEANDMPSDGAGKAAAKSVRGPLLPRAASWLRRNLMLIANAGLWTVLTMILISGPVLLSASVLLDGVFYLFCIVCMLKPEILSGVIRDIMRSLRRTEPEV
ncbi:hypothetical protein [Roseobacter ponti]|uniref:Uncharacterized protein n=1 Tax=Roseobacter ponti TaxID=1891787 RepID=A0A858SQB3_9RHOB|nr:hypothetical protein [Roseobacter ponti]QJF49861.1 hypothetical protein G3256_01100 [Roseobacter ponti]